MDKESLREELKEEIKDELRHEERVRRRVKTLGCLAVYVLVIGTPVILALVFIARSGLFMRVPLLSASLYKPVTPREVVLPLVGTDAETVLKEVAYAAKTDPKTGVVTLTIDEQQLTTSVRAGFEASAQSLPFPVNAAQVSIGAKDAELFFTTVSGGREVPVSLVFAPAVASGQVKVEVEKLTIGGATVPQALTGSAASLVNSLLLTELTANLPAGFTLDSLAIEGGKLVLKARVPTK